MMSAFSFASLLGILAGTGTEEDLDTAHNLASTPLFVLLEHLVPR